MDEDLRMRLKELSIILQKSRDRPLFSRFEQRHGYHHVGGRDIVKPLDGQKRRAHSENTRLSVSSISACTRFNKG